MLISSTLTADHLLALHSKDPERYPAILQSTAANTQTGQFDILMAFPGERLQVFATPAVGKGVSAAYLLDYLDRDVFGAGMRANASPLPFQGGWLVYFAYELAREFEPRLSAALPATGVVAEAIRIPAGIVRSHTGETWIFAEAGSEALAARIEFDLANLPERASFAGPAIEGAVGEETPQRFLHAVEAALHYISAGDIYQANLSRCWNARLSAGATAQDVYRRLCRANPAPFAAIAALGHTTIVSSSPERLIDIQAPLISTRPIAGTRPRSRDMAMDVDLAAQLRADPKERAEHTMLIDLERNDLGRVCEAGTVQVDEFMSLESYAHVHHIVSNVSGRLRKNVPLREIISAVFPGGTITGCPKIRCMEIIAELEGGPRHAYTGSIGYLGRDGRLDLNILIRTLEIRGRTISFRAGAGIVADSIPRRELEETRAKARGLIAALTDPAFA